MRLLLPALVLAAAIAIACSGSDDASDGDRLHVVASTTQIGDFAANVGGDRIRLTVLMRPNQDAHDVELEPSQVRAIAEADIVLLNGFGLDSFAERALGDTRAAVINVGQGVRTREGAHDHDDHDNDHEDDEHQDDDNGHGHDDEDGVDPHIWLSVDNARHMVENVRDALMNADSANASFYEQNTAAYLARLDELDGTIRALVAEVPESCRKLVMAHDVFGYYAEAYGFQVVGAVIPSVTTEAQASAADVASIVTRIREENVPAVFAEASSNPALVNQVGREAGIKVVPDLYGDSLGPPDSDGGTYIDMMESNTRKIVGALKDC